MSSTESSPTTGVAVTQVTLDEYRAAHTVVCDTMGYDPELPIQSWPMERIEAVLSLLPDACVPADRKIGSVLNALDVRRTQLLRHGRKVEAKAKAVQGTTAPMVPKQRVKVTDTKARGAVRDAMPYVPRADTLIGKYVMIGMSDAGTNREQPIFAPATDVFCAGWADTSVSRRGGPVAMEAVRERSAIIADASGFRRRTLTEASAEFRTLALAYAVGEAVQGTTAPETVAPPMNARERREAARIAAGKYVKG